MLNDSQNISADIQSGLVKEAIYVGNDAALELKRSVVSGFNPAVVFTFLKENQLILSPVPTYDSTFQSNFFGSIWQPPQIV